MNDIVAAAELVRNDLDVCIMPKPITDRFMAPRPHGEAPWAIAALLRHITCRGPGRLSAVPAVTAANVMPTACLS